MTLSGFIPKKFSKDALLMLLMSQRMNERSSMEFCVDTDIEE